MIKTIMIMLMMIIIKKTWEAKSLSEWKLTEKFIYSVGLMKIDRRIYIQCRNNEESDSKI